MVHRKRIVIYVDVKPRTRVVEETGRPKYIIVKRTAAENPHVEVDNRIIHPEHALVEESVDIMQGFMDFMARPIENFNKMLKYFIKAVTFSD